MWIKKLFFCFVVLCSGWVQAQTVWPSVQSNMYPYISNMKLVRHEQTVLLGEGNQQTGIFYSTLGDTYSEQVSSELINDALLKSWRHSSRHHQLVSLVRPELGQPIGQRCIERCQQTVNLCEAGMDQVGQQSANGLFH